MAKGLFNRGTGLLVIEVRCSNPNGDPDAESDPRTLDADGRGLISAVSFKRKLRDLVAEKEGPVWEVAAKTLQINGNGRGYDILESYERNLKEIGKLDRDQFIPKYWDARVFGNTILEAIKAENKKGKEHFISTGVVQFGVGISIAPVEIQRLTTTNPPVEPGKDRGMAPLGWRVVQHGVYTMPFYVNPTFARNTGCDETDIKLLKFLIPYAYSHTASAIRTSVNLLHAWYAEHKSPLGSCPDYKIIDALTPKKKTTPQEPSKSLDEYEIPTDKSIDASIKSRVTLTDLCTNQ
ncbi:MAG TPA: type I CRISPR-associated protein Cas7 [Hyphomicrobiaceae bacterium]|nr:type I CRISPR-associated protein Cas7 [Hyphomicrobiaceae bacterium]